MLELLDLKAESSHGQYKSFVVSLVAQQDSQTDSTNPWWSLKKNMQEMHLSFHSIVWSEASYRRLFSENKKLKANEPYLALPHEYPKIPANELNQRVQLNFKV